MADLPRASQWLSRDGAGPYVIQVLGELEPHWELELRMRLTCHRTEAGVVSVLSGELPDQCALLGALGQLVMWGYLIIMVRYGSECDEEDPDGQTAYTDCIDQ